MMKKEYVFIGASLLISLFIYLFYRTDQTLINELVARLISVAAYTRLKATISHNLPLSDILVYSLPEGLWIFCITLTSKPFYIDLNGQRINCVYIPLIFCFSLEILQLFHVTNGRFDFMDIAFFVLFWLLGNYSLQGSLEKKHILSSVNSKTYVFLASYAIVYLAHVFR